MSEISNKKFKFEFKSSISFWSDTNKDNFEKDLQIAESELSFTSAEINSKTESFKPSNIKFIIRDIFKSEDSITLYGDDVVCTVDGEWCSIDFEINTKITVMSCLCCDKDLQKIIKDSYIHVYVNDEENYLFIEDDLLTITNLVSSIRCINNPYLNGKIADIGFTFNDKCLVNGIILHEIMEDCILNQNFKLSYITKSISAGIKKNLMNIYCCNTSEKVVRDDITSLIGNIISFNKQNLVFNECEKRIASLSMNLKGNVDAVGLENNIVLEIKSGKSMDISHKAQVILYSLILKEKYRTNFQSYLFYITANNFVNVDIKHSEVKSLMILRNKLAMHNSITNCSCCEYDPCRIIQKILNLSDSHWLKKMWNALEKEESFRLKETWHLVKFKKQCDQIVVFAYDSKNIVVDDIYINIYTEDLVKLCKGIINEMDSIFLHVSLSEKINLEKNNNYYISFGNSDVFFKFMRYSLIYIAYFRYLQKNKTGGFFLPDEDKGFFEEEDSFEYFSSDEIETSKVAMGDSVVEKNNNTIVKNNVNTANKTRDCCLNKHSFDDTCTNKYDEIEKDLKKKYTENLASSSLDSGIFSSLDRQINHVIDDQKKLSLETNSSSFAYFTPLPPEPKRYKYQIPEIYMSKFLRLNENQKAALYSALNCENYKIVHGMPGTGKSSVIVLLIKILVYLNKKVLLVCYTNLAITNILSRLKTIRSYRACKENINFSSVQEIKTYFRNVDLVASTCFGFRDPIFLERSFDYCIIDEGSQQHLLLTLIPISLCQKFVIFGDHLQLKPLSKSCTDLNMSLFEYLLDVNHSELTIQYRMGPNIMRLSNELFYDGKLQLGRSIEDSVCFIDSSTIEYSKFIKDVYDTTILCYFNSQVKITKELTDCQVETVDRFQGSEANNIIVVFDPVVKCDVIESKERLNVALTRAKRSLILIGDLTKMKDIYIINRLLQILNIV